ncbi:MAG: hypothetical protein IKV21_04335, partial [Clostridia bacterium]|nr:hypothetical protein [Clostridia bacterium]
MKRLLRFFLFIFMFSAVTLFSLFFVNAGCIHSDEYIGDTLAEVLVKEPTCTEEGYTLFLCSVCDGFYESMRKPVTGHDFSADEKRTNMVLNDDNTHSYYCLNCYKCVGTASEGIDGKESCSFSLASYEKETCTQLGVKVYMCDICYRSKEETVGVKQHIYSKIRKLPTCTEKGYDMFTCKECGDSYKDNYTDVKEHISDGGKLEVIPTYDNGGVLKYSCRVCDYVIGRENVPKLTKYVKKPAPEKVKGFKVKSADSSSV